MKMVAGSSPWLVFTRRFANLVRFSHTIFALPFALGSMFVAAHGLPRWDQFAAIVWCMFTARNVAMAFNRVADARLDALNPRTAGRHLPSGQLSVRSVVVFIGANALGFMAGAWWLSPLAFRLAFPVLLFLMSYSLWKRFSWLCHWFLGLAIGSSSLGAWIAIRNEFAWFPVALGCLLMFWMGGFDIIYATQDEDVDRRLGLHSVPVRFGISRALKIAAMSHFLMLGVGGCMGYIWKMGTVWWIVMGILTLLMGYIHGFRRSSDLDTMNRDFFLANAAVSVLVMVGLVIWLFQGGHVT